MDLQLKGKTALVLAASKGLGKACALALSREGANIVIGARNPDALEATAGEIRQATGGNVLPIPIDITNAAEAQNFVDKASNTFGRIDILVNNAGGPPFGTFESFDEQAWQKAFELNLLSVTRLVRLTVPHMQKIGSGRIINITSLSVKTLLPGSVLSTSMRLGVVGMAKLLSTELGPDNITVNNVAPGLILTDRVKELGGNIDDKVKNIPVRRIGQPDELAALVAFLASPIAGYITGTTIPIDGGSVQSIL
jgi:3-oxoacyl-[acyl-carrier protein] reductase